jgi:hypothetical protein
MENGKKATEEIAKKISTDKSYTDRIFTDFEFARSEFSKAGVEIDPTEHKQMMTGYESLTNSFRKTFGPVRFSLIVGDTS